MATKYVNQFQLNWLTWCDQVIRWTRETLLVHGPGNQAGWIRGKKRLNDDVQQNANDPRPRVALVQEMVRKVTEGKDWFSPLFMYAAARTYGAANCQEYAAVMYTYLREVLRKTEYVIVVVNPEQHHCFTLISPEPVEKSPHPANCFAVDPWPTEAQAVLLEDHFCWPENGWAGLSVLRSKPGTGGKSKDLRRKARAWAEAQVQWDPKKVDKKVLEYEERLRKAGMSRYPEGSFFIQYCAQARNGKMEYLLQQEQSPPNPVRPVLSAPHR